MDFFEFMNLLKGAVGEVSIATIFSFYFCLNGLEYKILMNVYLKNHDGSTTEIDSIIISEYGIFVIESKNYSGWIFGSYDDLYWTQRFHNGNKYKFFSPKSKGESCS